MNEQELFDRAKRTFQQNPISTFMNRIKAIVGPPAAEYEGLAEEAMTALKSGQTPTPKQLAALEVVIRLMRPAPLSKTKEFGPLEPELAPSFPNWDKFRNDSKPYLYSVGRVDLLPSRALGTGFLVSANILATNKHVLDLLSSGAFVLQEGQAVVRFRYEFGTTDKEVVPIIGVVAVHPELDIALLRLKMDSLPEARVPLEIETSPKEVGHPIVAVGYPMNDPIRNPLFIGPIFGNRFGVKRAAPGEVIGHEAHTVYHDCSTLGGNSGSPLLSMESSKVIGIHKEGSFLFRNGAVDGASLKTFVDKHSH